MIFRINSKSKNGMWSGEEIGVAERKRDVMERYKGNYTRIKEYGVDYACVGLYERGFTGDNHFELNYSAFEDPARFYLKFDKVIEGERWRIYKVKTPTSQTC